MTESDFAALGITPESIAHAMAFGFGFILSSFVLGWVAGIVIGLVKKL